MRAIKHVRGLDGLRAVAVTLVFLSHRAHFGAVDVGQIGVWTFFLISGFLIVGELHRSRLAIERGTSCRRYAFWLFAGKRALRILPVYYLLLAALAIAHRHVYQHGVDLGLRWHVVFLSDYWIGAVKDGWPGSTSHFWSLAVEQQFYLIAPLVLLATRASRHLAFCAAAVALAAVAHALLYLRHASPVLIYAFSPWNFALIALGGIGGILHSGGVTAPKGVVGALIPWVGAAGAAFCSTLALWAAPLSAAAGGPADIALGVSLGILLFWIVSRPEHPAVALLEWAPIAYLGTISYGFYLFHNLIPEHFGVMPGLYERLHVPHSLRELLPEILQFLLSVLLAHLSWQYLEKRVLDYKKPLETVLRRRFAPRERTAVR
ncbi:O-acetyltransferase OatA [Burkholderia oklahomensis]|nr:acyltransferase [Burkholderia oklahomensis]AJX35763.1 acyltransferase family protein [Burkholderia oklahomensis C6786]AOI48446.1 acyltransferase [Burkholderia oklahomensis C6786]KUY52254.1 acyltransferase [Burkholderia oklahomensis C6786]MBI0363396.1 acyltransferase [Burkholderia oklahomensis]SUY27515.1 O-acetyltransferase OatA [Burkholderia oklahomensis]